MPDCKNCKSSFSGNYCPHCGQLSITEFTWGFIVSSIWDALEFNRGFLFNLKEFTLRPRITLSNYLNGLTKPYTNPISYNLIGVSALFISTQLMDHGADDILYSRAETFVYMLSLIFPFLFAVVLFISKIGNKPSLLYALITSLFLSGHLLILLVSIKILGFLVGLMISIEVIVVMILFLIAATYYIMRFAKEFLNYSLTKVLVRLTFSSIFVFGIVIIILSIILAPGLDRAWDLGEVAGRIVYVLFNFK